MFNNIIYFIIVLLILNLGPSERVNSFSLVISIIFLLGLWGSFALYCRAAFRGLALVSNKGRSVTYHRLIQRLSILALLMFILAVYVLNLKYLLGIIPVLDYFPVMQQVMAMALFLFYLGTMWFFAAPAYDDIFDMAITRLSFVASNFRLNLPILLPWICVSLLHDISAFFPLSWFNGFFKSMSGQLFLYSGCVALLIIFMPVLVCKIWGCKDFGNNEKVKALKKFLQENGFRYGRLMEWPIFEGRMLTAGIMGIVPKYRYLLVSDSLMNALTENELKAVLAHEMGHARYRHLLIYLIFFVGFLALSFGVIDFLIYPLYLFPTLYEAVKAGYGPDFGFINMALSFPLLFAMYIYFRYLMGFFMRHFERQADLYSAAVMKTAKYTIASLEKIAELSGKIRDLPSWHHFSIKERTECLGRLTKAPVLLKRHNRFLAVTLISYLILTAGLVYILNFSTLKNKMNLRVVENIVERKIKEKPGDASIFYFDLAMIYHERGEYGKAVTTYEKVIKLEPDHVIGLNNLAWLLVTSPEKYRDHDRGIELAEKAVSIERSSVFLDTLAEAYYVDGRVSEALKTIEEALDKADKNIGYYRQQRKKFMDAISRR